MVDVFVTPLIEMDSTLWKVLFKVMSQWDFKAWFLLRLWPMSSDVKSSNFMESGTFKSPPQSWKHIKFCEMSSIGDALTEPTQYLKNHLSYTFKIKLSWRTSQKWLPVGNQISAVWKGRKEPKWLYRASYPSRLSYNNKKNDYFIIS